MECGPGDRECMVSLCPGGMMYSEEDTKCVRLPGEMRNGIYRVFYNNRPKIIVLQNKESWLLSRPIAPDMVY